MINQLGSIAGAFSSLQRDAMNERRNVQDCWNDSLSERFDANYWQPYMDECDRLESAFEELYSEISSILSQLP